MMDSADRSQLVNRRGTSCNSRSADPIGPNMGLANEFRPKKEPDRGREEGVRGLLRRFKGVDGGTWGSGLNIDIHCVPDI